MLVLALALKVSLALKAALVLKVVRQVALL